MKKYLLTFFTLVILVQLSFGNPGNLKNSDLIDYDHYIPQTLYKPSTISAIDWLQKLEAVRVKQPSSSILEVLNKEISATIAGKYGLSDRQATEEESIIILASVLITRQLYDNQKDVYTDLYFSYDPQNCWEKLHFKPNKFDDTEKEKFKYHIAVVMATDSIGIAYNLDSTTSITFLLKNKEEFKDYINSNLLESTVNHISAVNRNRLRSILNNKISSEELWGRIKTLNEKVKYIPSKNRVEETKREILRQEEEIVKKAVAEKAEAEARRETLRKEKEEDEQKKLQEFIEKNAHKEKDLKSIREVKIIPPCDLSKEKTKEIIEWLENRKKEFIENVAEPYFLDAGGIVKNFIESLEKLLQEEGFEKPTNFEHRYQFEIRGLTERLGVIPFRYMSQPKEDLSNFMKKLQILCKNYRLFSYQKFGYSSKQCESELVNTIRENNYPFWLSLWKSTGVR